MGTLYIVATPIGNLEDITIRAVKTLFSVDFIACEDTRRTIQLLNNLELRTKNQELYIKNLDVSKKPKLISYYDEVEFKRVPEIIELLIQGKNIALVSDSGTPLISDPGYKLVCECINQGIKIISIPGPSSVISALAVSGLPPNDFRFIGYLPDKSSKRQKLLKDIQKAIRTERRKYIIIAFETSHRLKESLKDLENIFGDIDITICRELTKIHEEVWRGKVSTAISHFTTPCGEITLLIRSL